MKKIILTLSFCIFTYYANAQNPNPSCEISIEFLNTIKYVIQNNVEGRKDVSKVELYYGNEQTAPKMFYQNFATIDLNEKEGTLTLNWNGDYGKIIISLCNIRVINSRYSKTDPSAVNILKIFYF